MKTRNYCLPVLGLFLLAACTPAPAPVTTPAAPAVVVSSSTPSQTTTGPVLTAGPATYVPTSTQTQRIRSTATLPVEKARTDDPLNVRNQPTPTQVIPTLTPAPTLYAPELVWGEVGEAQLLPLFKGRWSPTANEMVGYVGTGRGDDQLFVTSGPDFVLQAVENSPTQLTGQLRWSPDGRRVVFGGLAENAEWVEFGYQSLWMMDHNGDNAHPLPIVISDYDIMWLPGWMDDRWLLLADYAGGGYFSLAKIDSWSDTTDDLGVTVHGPIYQPNQQYIPVVNESAGPYDLLVITQKPQPEERQARLIESGQEYTWRYPGESWLEFGDRQVPVGRIFKTWLPGSNRIILFEYVYEEDVLLRHASIREWNLDKDEARLLAPNAIDAFVSDDGKLLGITTFGQAPLGPDGEFQQEVPFPEDSENSPTFLNLLDLATEQVVLQLPVLAFRAEPDDEVNYAQLAYEASAAFSPNGRYLAFCSPDVIQLDPSGVPLGVAPGAWADRSPQVNILDLQTRHIIFSTPVDFLVDWSPKSDRLVYQKEDGNWFLYDVAKGDEVAITQAGGWNIDHPRWSFSGSYLIFWAWVTPISFDNDLPVGHTFVLTMPER